MQCLHPHNLSQAILDRCKTSCALMEQHYMDQTSGKPKLNKALKSIFRESHFPKRLIINHPKERTNCFSVFSLPEMVLYKAAEYICHGLAELLHLQSSYPTKFSCCAPLWKYTKQIYYRGLSEPRVEISYIESISPLQINYGTILIFHNPSLLPVPTFLM